jgi:hypothetical protein
MVEIGAEALVIANFVGGEAFFDPAGADGE